jgi:hypothetical protein
MRRNAVMPLVVATLLAGCWFLAVPQAAEAKGPLWQLSDPRDDDNGDGGLIYPTSTDYVKGELDLVGFRAERDKGGTTFVATFARPIRQPGRGAADGLGTPMSSIFRFGFYTFNIDVYIDKDREPGSGGIALLPGRKAEIAPEFAWDRVVALTPRPNEARELLSRLVLEALRAAQEPEVAEDPEVRKELKKTVPTDLETRAFFPNRVRVRGNTVSFFVPDSFLGGAADPSWSYLIVVSGSDAAPSLDLGGALGVQRDEVAKGLMILPISPGSWSNRFGGGRENDPLQPPLVDVVVPTGANQGRLLRDRSPRENRPVVLPGVIPAAEAGAPEP